MLWNWLLIDSPLNISFTCIKYVLYLLWPPLKIGPEKCARFSDGGKNLCMFYWHQKLNVCSKGQSSLPPILQLFFLTFSCFINSYSGLPDIRLELCYFQCPLFPGYPRSFAKPSSFPLCSAPPNCLFFPFSLPSP